MASFAAYTGLRWGELAALTADQVDQDTRVVTVDRKVIEIGGKLTSNCPRAASGAAPSTPAPPPPDTPSPSRSRPASGRPAPSRTPGPTPWAWSSPPPAAPTGGRRTSPAGSWRPAYLAAGWRDPDGAGIWVWHSLRHVFCTTALFTWNMEPADVSRLAGHASIRITLDMYIGTTAGTLDRARTATQ